jgi:hypothetical protein
MIIYSHEGGYCNIDVDTFRRNLQCNIIDRGDVAALLYDYEILLKILKGEGIFRLEDGSEVRRIKLYER